MIYKKSQTDKQGSYDFAAKVGKDLAYKELMHFTPNSALKTKEQNQRKNYVTAEFE